MVEVKCKNCGKKFEVYPSRAKATKELCCSLKCRKELLAKRRRGTKVRPKCEIEGCNNLARKAHKRKNGGYYYGRLCQSHHKKRYNMQPGGASHTKKLAHLTKEPCEICGWNKSYCDLHRIIPGNKGGEYIKNNIMILCPNCHRVMHHGEIKSENRQELLEEIQNLPDTRFK